MYDLRDSLLQKMLFEVLAPLLLTGCANHVAPQPVLPMGTAALKGRVLAPSGAPVAGTQITVVVEGGPVAFEVLSLLACVWGERLCMPEVWGGDGASDGGAASGDASGVGVSGAFSAGSTVGKGAEQVA